MVQRLFYKHNVFLGQPQYAYDFLIWTLYYAYNMLQMIESVATIMT